MPHDAPTQPPSPETLKRLGKDILALRQDLNARTGDDDAAYLRRIIFVAQALEATGRCLLLLSFHPVIWLAGTACLAASKIIENAEIGHNVMHDQYDWLGKPGLRGDTYEWDSAALSANWRLVHNQRHHRHTGIIGVDKDAILFRLGPGTPWKPRYLLQPFLLLFIIVFYEWLIAVQRLTLGGIFRGDKSASPSAETLRTIRPILGKILRQHLKDYVIYPVICYPNFLAVLAGNLAANMIRNAWISMVTLCNHFTPGVELFDASVLVEQPREHRHYRQIRSSSNFTGSRMLHILSGHLGYHIEHHLYPTLPASRLPEAAREVQAICARHGIPYNTGPLHAQLGRVLRNILRYAFP